MKLEDLKYRTFRFSVAVIQFLKKEEWNKVNDPVFRQLLRSSCSIGANIVEGRSGNSDREMIKYYRIAFKSANETKYWLCIIREALEIKNERVEFLLKEVDEISRIIASSVITMNKNEHV